MFINSIFANQLLWTNQNGKTFFTSNVKSFSHLRINTLSWKWHSSLNQSVFFLIIYDWNTQQFLIKRSEDFASLQRGVNSCKRVPIHLMMSLAILIHECLPIGWVVFSLFLTCFSRKVNKHTWKLWKTKRTEKKLKKKGFCFYQGLKATLEKYPKAACHEKPPLS